jgi:hypothetical protein
MTSSAIARGLGVCIVSALLAACGGGGGDGSGGASTGASNPGGGTSGDQWFFAVRAYDDAGNVGPYSNEIQGSFADNSTAELTWTSPSRNVDGTCTYDLAGYRVAIGQRSGSYSQIVAIPVASQQVSCQATGSGSCGDVLTCTYTTPPLVS